MDINIRVLVDRIVKDNKIETILEELGMHHIKSHDKYYSCGMPDGDNTSSTLVFKNNLNVQAYTRNIADKFGNSDIISLVMFVKNIYFLNAIKWISDNCGYDYYNIDCERPNVLKFMDKLKDMKGSRKTDENEVKLKPIPHSMLNTYLQIPSYKFYLDGIDFETQMLFEVSYDLQTHRIVVPIYDELGNLVGMKGRINYESEDDCKYIYLHSVPKSLVLFGLDKTYENIIEKGIVYVAESEKAVMQAWSNGVKNVVSIGGKQLSRAQVKKLTYLGVEICLAYDDHANYETRDGESVLVEDFYKKEKDKFLDSIEVSHIFDENNLILKNKQSPFDNMNEWDNILKMKRYIL